MNPVFSTNHFWRPYLTLEPEGISKDDFTAQLDGLRPDFAVHENTIHFEHAGHPHTFVRRFVEFPFSCGEQYSLLLEYGPGENECTKNLFLVDSRSGTKSAMGWWDCARWHPYCLRPEEFDSLLQFWSRADQRYGQNVALLLLCQFVGLPDANTRDSLATRVQTAAQALGLQPGGDPLEIPLHVPDSKYRWEMDAELGWVFTSDEYCCYSLRNRPHAESNEGRFPFTAFQEMMNDVQRLGTA